MQQYNNLFKQDNNFVLILPDHWNRKQREKSEKVKAGGSCFAVYLRVRLAGPRWTQRGDFGGAGGRPGGGDGPPSLREPGERDEGSRGTRRTLGWLSEDRRHEKHPTICLFSLFWFVWDVKYSCRTDLLPTESLLDLSFLTRMYERLRVTLRDTLFIIIIFSDVTLWVTCCWQTSDIF